MRGPRQMGGPRRRAGRKATWLAFEPECWLFLVILMLVYTMDPVFFVETSNEVTVD
jgi:hypothetical protein